LALLLSGVLEGVTKEAPNSILDASICIGMGMGIDIVLFEMDDMVTVFSD